MTSKKQQIQNNSSVDNDSQVERLPKQYPLNYPPSAQEKRTINLVRDTTVDFPKIHATSHILDRVYMESLGFTLTSETPELRIWDKGDKTYWDKIPELDDELPF